MSEIKPNMNDFADLERQAEDLERQAEAIGEKPPIPLAELFPNSFLTKYTDFGSLEEMVRASGYKIESQADVDNIPHGEWNAFVARHTRFSSWEQMLQIAAVEWAARKLAL